MSSPSKEGLMELTAKTVFLGLGLSVLAVWALRGKRQPEGLLVVGDSLSAGPGAYPKLLEKDLGVPVRTEAFKGKGVEFLRDNVPWLTALSGKSHLIVLAGVNDIASRRDLHTTKTALAEIYATARRYGVTVVGVAPTPWEGHTPNKKQQTETRMLDQWVMENADIYVSTKQLGKLGRLRREYDSGDGLHLNRTGQRKLAELIEQRI